ncbi:hypothetical protein A6R68_15551, partial [Neotoma lepida]
MMQLKPSLHMLISSLALSQEEAGEEPTACEGSNSVPAAVKYSARFLVHKQKFAAPTKLKNLHFLPTTNLANADFGTNECYEELNSKTDISGNCGISTVGYKACAPNDRKCGKLICKYRSDNLVRIRSATIIYANISGQICVSLEYAQDHQESHNMWVRDGTVCGSNKICLNKECVEDNILNYDCTPEKCNHRGVCNNRKNCHCNPTYLPPDCRDTEDEWPGGSIDSFEETAGSKETPDPKKKLRLDKEVPENKTRPPITSAYHHKPTRWPFFLIIPVYIVICVLIATLVKVYSQRKRWRSKDYSSD